MFDACIVSALASSESQKTERSLRARKTCYSPFLFRERGALGQVIPKEADYWKPQPDHVALKTESTSSVCVKNVLLVAYR
ncbi:hypothetical protein NPIL_273211 [Nephila pilipes]|uniref:Uncharacterized protein n=1 Tax=Nephila pilipes TaxID=299642 RepID=A0A8X6PTV2_NEPPI|nr:hypothetical protein NPIL_273211 [Nephila pilipes]